MAKITNDILNKAAKKYAKATGLTNTIRGNEKISAQEKALGVVKLMSNEDIKRIANASAYSIKKIKEDFDTIASNPGNSNNDYLRNNLISKGVSGIGKSTPGPSNSMIQASGSALYNSGNDADTLAANLSSSYKDLYDNDNFGRGAGELANWTEDLDDSKPGFVNYVLNDTAAYQSLMTAADVYYDEVSGETDYVTKQLKDKLYQIWNMYDPDVLEEDEE